MWKNIESHRLDLHLIKLQADGTFLIPALKQEVTDPPFTKTLHEYDLDFQKTSEGRELRILQSGQLAMRLRFTDRWQIHQETDEQLPDFVTSVPGARRRQLTLADEETVEQRWLDNVDFRTDSYKFLKDKWAEADEFGVHVPKRTRFSETNFAWFSLILALTVLWVASKFLTVHEIPEIRLQHQAALIATVKTEIPRPPASKSEDQTQEQHDNEESVLDTDEHDSTNSVTPNFDKVQTTDTLGPDAKNDHAEKREMEAEAKPVVLVPKIDWKYPKATLLQLEVGDEFGLACQISPVNDQPFRLYYHVGPWKSRASRLVECEDCVVTTQNEAILIFELEKEKLTGLKVDDDGLERGTIAVQFVATNNESPYLDEDKLLLHPHYAASMIRRDKFPLRVFTNRKPVFEELFVQSVDSGSIPFSQPQTVMIQGDEKSTVAISATDPEGEASKSLHYELLNKGKWTKTDPHAVPLDATQSGHFHVMVRARDQAMRYSEPTKLDYTVNFAPSIQTVDFRPKWPIPGSRLRIFVDALDPEDDLVTFTTSVTIGGKQQTLNRLTHFDSSGKLEIPRSTALYEIKDVPKGELLFQSTVADDRFAKADMTERTTLIPDPPQPILVPRTPKTMVNSLGLNFIEIPAGEFIMGSPTKENGRSNDEPLHGVRITKPFYFQEMEFPGKLRHLLMVGDGKSQYKKGPALFFDWNQAQYLCRILNDLPAEAKAGRTYRLPTEAEWEYACRAGSHSPFHVKEDDGRFLTTKHAKIVGKYSGYPETQKEFAPNAFGLYDMHGNAAELCVDKYDETFYWIAPIDDPSRLSQIGPKTYPEFVVRGGNSFTTWEAARSAVRRNDHKAGTGVRLVCEIGKPRIIKPFSGDFQPDETVLLWNSEKWKFEEDTISINVRTTSSDNYLVTHKSVTDFEFTCEVKIEPFEFRNKKEESDTVIGIIPRGQLGSISPPGFTYMAYHVTLGKQFWGSVRNSWIPKRGTIIQPDSEATQKIEQSVSPGQFSTLKVRCVGQRITVWINEIQAVDREFPDMPAKGKFGIFWTCPGRRSGKAVIRELQFQSLAE